MSWTEIFPSGPGAPDALGLRELTLSALAGAALTLRDGDGCCHDCAPRRPCADHRHDLTLAAAYEAAYMRIRGIGSDGAMLQLTGGLTS